MNTDNIYLNNEARTKLIAGANKVADAVKLTLGAAGANAILQEGLYPYHITTNDGVSVANKIHLSDPVEQMGANIMKEIADRANKESGDGTTTSIVLTQAILQEGMKSDASPMEIKRSLDECLPIILKSIDDQTKQITPKEVGQVATISSEDEKMGALFQEIYEKIGKDGIVDLDNSGLPDTFYEITEGVRLRGCGFTYPYMANDGKGKVATYLVPKVLITKQKITSMGDIVKLIRALQSQSVNELVIFCDEIDPSVSSALAYLHHGTTPQGTALDTFRILIIKAPTLWKDWLFEDFAKITGATIIDPSQGTSFKTLGMHHLGTCDKIVTTKDETVITGIHDISAHIKALQENNTDDSRLRLAWLQTKTAVLKLGANSESELSYKRLKAEDARNASYLALQGGVVAGGGIGLFNVFDSLPKTIGGNILRVAIQSPLKQIISNYGGLDEKSSGTIGKTLGFNAKTGEIVDMWQAGILDPALVVKNSIRNAISVAGTVLTARIVVTEHKETK